MARSFNELRAKLPKRKPENLEVHFIINWADDTKDYVVTMPPGGAVCARGTLSECGKYLTWIGEQEEQDTGAPG